MDTNTEIIPQRDIELSISQNYVCSWGFWEAMREIFQNAIDSDNQGHTMNITLSSDKSTILIFNEDVYLPINSLVLGNSTKGSDSIGKYGEGYKLALVVLLRLGYNVDIKVGNDLWVPYFDYSETLQTEVLKIKVMEGQNKLYTNGTTFQVSGLSSIDRTELMIKCLPYRKFCNGLMGKILNSEYGEILLDSSFKGKFYVEGLYIQDDDTFKYGYSFKKEYVDLDRDRRAINYYDLLELTTNSLLSQTEDVTIVETCLSSKEKDVRELSNFYADIPQDFAVGYAKHFIEKHNLTEDTFVGTEKETLVANVDKVFVTDKVQAKIVNQGLGKDEEYNEVKKRSEQKDNRDLAWKYYHEHVLYSMHRWLVQNVLQLSTKQVNAYLDMCLQLKPDSFSLIKQDVYDNLITELKSKSKRYKGGFKYV